MAAHTPEDAKVGLAQVKMRDKTSRARLAGSIARYNDGLMA